MHDASAGATITLGIRLKRHVDGSASLTCTRADGSSTWQRHQGPSGAVMPHHDLTHFAVETSLHYREGFFGLIAQGWEIADFARPWPRGPIPDSALEVELIVGFFDAERREGLQWTSQEFLAHADVYVAARQAQHPGRAIPRRDLNDEEIERVRACRDELSSEWARTPTGSALDLQFAVHTQAASS